MAEENKETPVEETTTSDAEDVEDQDQDQDDQEVQEEEAVAEGEEAEEAEEGDEADDTPFDPSEYLQMKIKLEDDSEAFLFSFGPKCKESGGNRPLNCHLCRVASLRDDMKKGHIQSKLHQRNLKRKVKPERYTKPYRQFCGINEEGKLMQFEINPGEDIEEVLPEEHKDRLFYKEAQYVRPKPDDLKVLKEEKLHEYNKTKPLLGLNYIFKMKSGEQIMYFCALCNLKLKGDAYLHIAGATHQASYIIKHFPNLYAKVQTGLEEIQNEVAVEHCTRNIFRYLYRKIENKKKRARVNLVDFEYFQKNRDEIVKKCLERNHFDENTIKFPKAELDILIRKSLKGIEFIKPDLKSLANPELGFRTVVSPVVENQRPMMMPRDGPPPPKMRRPDLSGATPENWTAYRVMLGNMFDEINFKYKMFEQNPRSHPQHQFEWKMYLQQRIRELKRDKIDPRSLDIQSEWAPRWIQRLRQLYAKDLANRKRELKRLLNLPFDRSPSPLRQMDQQMPEPMHWQCERQPQPPTPSQPMFGAPNMIQGRPLPIFTEDTPIVSSEPLSVISVMRLLTALEDQLGSLGPKAVQLLSRAVLCEKDSGNTDQLLLDNDYYVFFATVKEKFRGQLQANVVEFSKRQAVSHCVNEISSILDIMEKSIAVERERRKEMEQKKRIQQQQQEEQRQQQNQRKQQQQGQQQQWQRGKMQQQGGGKFDGGNNQQKNMGSNQHWNNMNESFGSGYSGNNQKGNQGGGGDAGGNLMNKQQQNRKRNAPGGAMPFGTNNNSNRGFQGGNSKSFWQQGQGQSSNSGDNFSNSPNTGRFENTGSNFGNRNNDNSDNFGRGGGGGGGNNNPSRNFNNQRGNNAGGGGGGGMKNFNDNNFGGGRNFSGGNNRNMDNRNDNFNRDFDSRNDGGNQGGNSGGGNFNMFSRNAGVPKNDNFGKNFGSNNMSGGGGDNFSGRGFGGNNQNRGFGGNNQGRNNNNSNNPREGGGTNLYSRRNDGGGSFGGGLNSFGGNNNNSGGGHFNRPNNNFGGRMPGFNSNFN